MCGIIGYTGTNRAAKILLDGLKKLEYRGYDSAGIAIQGETGIDVIRRKGKVSVLEEAVAGASCDGTCGIGHTRWATHGKPSEENAHPHSSCDGKVAIVHNGIIENFTELRDELIDKGHRFASDTDTEVIAHLIEEYYDGELLDAVHKATDRLAGSWGLAATCTAEPGKIVVTRHNNPIVLARTDSGCYVASDLVAVIRETRNIIVLGDQDFAVLSPDGIYCEDKSSNEKTVIETYIDWDLDSVEKGGYPDFMLKEIYEQPRVIRDTLAGRLENGCVTIEELSLSKEEFEAIDKVTIVACGTSYHAGLIARKLIEGWARIPCDVEVASEFRYGNPIITATTLVVAVSQSGETADTLAAVREARIKGAKVFGITNVIGSPVAREADGVIYTKANKEIAVASTKSFLGQVVSLTLLTMVLARTKGLMNENETKLLFSELENTAEQVEEVLDEETSALQLAARACKDAHSALFIGRGMGDAISKEGALKLKEISYLHAESYPAGEMKHGPIALLDDKFPVIAIATNSPTYDKVISNIQEAKARGAMVVAIATKGDKEIRKHADHVIYIPKVRDCFSPIVASVPLQLLARDIAVMRGCNVDQPRNLAKSVTVE